MFRARRSACPKYWEANSASSALSSGEFRNIGSNWLNLTFGKGKQTFQIVGFLGFMQLLLQFSWERLVYHLNIWSYLGPSPTKRTRFSVHEIRTWSDRKLVNVFGKIRTSSRQLYRRSVASLSEKFMAGNPRVVEFTIICYLAARMSTNRRIARFFSRARSI